MDGKRVGFFQPEVVVSGLNDIFVRRAAADAGDESFPDARLTPRRQLRGDGRPNR